MQYTKLGISTMILSPENIMFHFPRDESKAYIGVCDWGMTTVATEPPKSLYTFTLESDKTEALRGQWWVDPDVAYLDVKDANLEIILDLLCVSKEFAVG